MKKRPAKFTPCVGFIDLPSHPTMKAAFLAFHAEVEKNAKRAKFVPLSWPETCWIHDSRRMLPLPFFEVIILAHKRGWLKKGKLQKP